MLRSCSAWPIRGASAARYRFVLADAKAFDRFVEHLHAEMPVLAGFVEDSVAHLIVEVVNLTRNADPDADGGSTGRESARVQIGPVAMLLGKLEN